MNPLNKNLNAVISWTGQPSHYSRERPVETGMGFPNGWPGDGSPGGRNIHDLLQFCGKRAKRATVFVFFGYIERDETYNRYMAMDQYL